MLAVCHKEHLRKLKRYFSFSLSWYNVIWISLYSFLTCLQRWYFCFLIGAPGFIYIFLDKIQDKQDKMSFQVENNYSDEDWSCVSHLFYSHSINFIFIFISDDSINWWYHIIWLIVSLSLSLTSTRMWSIWGLLCLSFTREVVLS